MDTVEKIIIGIVIFVVTSIVAYLFRMRQLYAAAPKLYRHAPISNDGSLCELIVYNKGNQAEEDIKVSLDPDIKAELLASSSVGITVSDSIVHVDRLHKGCEASMMLLVENGLFDSSKILSVSSKGTQGRVCKKTSDIPPNFARYFLFLVFVVGFFPGMYYGSKAYSSVNAAYVEYRLQLLYKFGWTDLSSYYASDLRQSYSDQEFPVRFAGRQTDKDKNVLLTFEAFNKTAIPLTVYADKKGARRDLSSQYFSSVEVPPMSQKSLTAKLPDPTPDAPQPEMEFSFKSGSEFLHGITFDVTSTQRRERE